MRFSYRLSAKEWDTSPEAELVEEATSSLPFSIFKEKEFQTLQLHLKLKQHPGDQLWHQQPLGTMVQILCSCLDK